MLFELTKGVALLLALSLLQSFVLRHWRQNEVLGQIASGVLFGCICVIGMKMPLEVVPGVIFDARSVILSMSGLFGGPIVGGIAAAIAGGYRAWIGGGGANVGVAVVISSMSLGLVYRYCRDRGWVKVGVFQLLAFGFVVHAVEVLLFTQLPADVVQKVMDNVAIPLLFTFTPATAFLGILLQDINNRMATENALVESEDRFRDFAESASDWYWEMGPDLTFTNMSPEFFEVTGLSKDAVISKPRRNLLHPDEDEEKWERHQAALNNHRPFKDFRYRLLTEIGRKCHLSVSGIPVFGKDGAFQGYRGIGRDITDLTLAEQALREAHDQLEQRVERRTRELQLAKKEAEQSSLAKTKFLAAASHDLRQPLQALNLFLSVLADRKHDSKSRRIISRIGDSAEALEGLLNALLDISKLEAGLVVPEKRRFGLAASLDRLTGEFKQRAKEKGLKFRAVACTAEIISDPTLLETVLRNLLSNAINHTENGEILLGCRNRDGMLRIEVWDTGVGIEKEHLDQIFQEFYQVGNPSRDRRQGLGLGLSIVCKTTELLGHGIEVESVPGKGSVFSIEVPKIDGEMEPATAVAPKQLQMFLNQPFVVVVDDDEDVLDGIKFFLESWGCRVLAVPCVNRSELGRCQPCHLCDELFQPGTATPELIIADYNLQNGMTGIEAVAVLNEHFKAETPAMLLTGDIKQESLIAIEKSGLLLLHKPIQGEKLRQEVFEALASSLTGRG